MAQKAAVPSFSSAPPTAEIPLPPPTPILDPIPPHAEPAQSDADSYYLPSVPIDDLHEDPKNPRKVYRDLEDLKESLLVHGILQAIVVRRGGAGQFIVMFGHRRLRAARLAGFATVPVVVRTQVDMADVLARQLNENVARTALDPMDEAYALKRWMVENKISTYDKAAKKLGVSLTWVTNRRALLKLDTDDQQAVSRGELPITQAVKKSRAMQGITRRSKNTAAPTTSTSPLFGTLRTTRVEPAKLPHLSVAHPLAERARARCRKGGMSPEHFPKVGETACGACWEAVIRIDALESFERVDLVQDEAASG